MPSMKRSSMYLTVRTADDEIYVLGELDESW